MQPFVVFLNRTTLPVRYILISCKNIKISIMKYGYLISIIQIKHLCNKDSSSDMQQFHHFIRYKAPGIIYLLFSCLHALRCFYLLDQAKFNMNNLRSLLSKSSLSKLPSSTLTLLRFTLTRLISPLKIEHFQNH